MKVGSAWDGFQAETEQGDLAKYDGLIGSARSLEACVTHYCVRPVYSVMGLKVFTVLFFWGFSVDRFLQADNTQHTRCCRQICFCDLTDFRRLS